jgi:hypothetical protein
MALGANAICDEDNLHAKLNTLQKNPPQKWLLHVSFSLSALFNNDVNRDEYIDHFTVSPCISIHYI